jgi:hypothetical protein
MERSNRKDALLGMNNMTVNIPLLHLHLYHLHIIYINGIYCNVL